MAEKLLEFPGKFSARVNDQHIIENAVVRLLKEKPFYGHLLLGFRRRLSPGAQALGVTVVNGTPTLNVDPDRFVEYTNHEQQALLEHVIKHLLHLHPVRGRGQHQLTWDVATDLAVNPTIAHLPAEALFPERYQLERGLAAEEYARLLKREFDTGRMSGQGLGDADQDVGGQAGPGAAEREEELKSHQPVDDHRIWSEADSTPQCLAEQAVRDMVREAHRKVHGEVPDDVSAIIEGWLAPPVIPWQLVLRQFVDILRAIYCPYRL